jgi:hypothetical protein
MPGTLVLAIAVDDDAAAVGLHAERFEADVLDVADTPTAEIIRSAVIFSTLPSLSLDMSGDGIRIPSQPL